MTPSAAHVRAGALDHALDGVAIAEQQRERFYRGDGDSLLELLPHVVTSRDDRARRFARLLADAEQANRDQIRHGRKVAGWLDTLATDLARSARQGGAIRGQLAAKSLARALRPHLRAIADADGVDSDVLRELRAVRRIADDATTSQILSRSVAHELGRGSFELLTTIVEGVAV